MKNSTGDRIEEKYTRYINCEIDILELTIEEAIFILEKDASVHYAEDLLQEAYKVILSDYKRVLKENEEYKNAINVVNKEKADWIRAYQEEKDKQFDFINKISSNDSIPVQKVKDKIEEIDKIYNDIPEDEGNFAKAILIKEKQVLQELLEGRE